MDDDLTALENLTLGAVLHGVPYGAGRRRAAEVLEIFSLGDVADVRAARLSGGMDGDWTAQALVHGPTVVFLDEPTTGLDPQSCKALWGLLRHLSENGTTSSSPRSTSRKRTERATGWPSSTTAGWSRWDPRDLKQEVGGGRLTLTIRDDADRSPAIQALASMPNVTRVQPGRPGEPLGVYVDDPSTSAPVVLRLLQAEGIEVASLECKRPSTTCSSGRTSSSRGQCRRHREHRVRRGAWWKRPT